MTDEKIKENAERFDELPEEYKGKRAMKDDNLNAKLFDSVLSACNREGMDKLLAWLHTTDFYTAPASSKYHLNREGGLLEHSVNVWTLMWKEAAADGIPNASKDIVSLLHDVCKVGLYTPVDGGYRYNKEVGDLGHGSCSVELIERFIELTPEEAEAIRWHMGLWDSADRKTVGEVYRRNTLAWKLHVADEEATFVIEKG